MSEKEMITQELETGLKITEISALGFGNPDSTIRYERLNDHEKMPEMIAAVKEIITSGRCSVDITDVDDGCIDGRTAIELTYIDLQGIQRTVQIELGTGHERQKVAGGGYITALSMELALHPPMDGVDTVLDAVISLLASEGIFCGMHTGSHQDQTACTTDCGANDKIEAILKNGVAFNLQIAPATELIIRTAGADYSPEAQARTINGWRRAVDDPVLFAESDGLKRSKTITQGISVVQNALEANTPLAVSKKLDSSHNERFIVVSFVEGKTFSQAKLRQELIKLFPDVDESDLPQVFVVDAPRIAALANAIGKNDEEKQAALHAGVSYQLATAATLTDGSLPLLAITR